MLTQLRIQNFKSLRDTGTLDIRPLTFLVGPNSSGKSSVLQVLLMLKQTVESRDESNPIVTNGEYVQLGSYRDFIHGHDTQRNLFIALGINGIQITSEFLLNPTDRVITLSRASVGEPRKGYTFRSEIVRVGRNEYEGSVSCDGDRPKRRVYRRAVPIKFYQASLYALDESASTGLHPDEWRDGSDMGSENEIIEGFSSIHYVGPLREAPQRYYLATGETYEDVGLRGERAINVLCTSGANNQQAESVLESVNEWAQRLGIAHEITLDQVGDDSLYRLLVQHPITGVEADVADVGFGISQVLPVLVEGFYAPEESTLLLEHPEIHLHPAVETRLGDLFIELATTENKTLIVETHSEHLLSRVQRRVAEGTIDPADVAIYYFDPQPGGTQVRRIGLTPLGQYENFPDGFFDEGYEEALAHARVMAERVRKEQARESEPQGVGG